MSRFDKRKSYVSDTESSTSEEENYYPVRKHFKLSTKLESAHARISSPLNKQFQSDRLQTDRPRPKRIPKVFSKNALMARENRMKKKLYVENLEAEVQILKTENKKYNTVIENQSFFIQELKKEIKYLKSVLANSADISKLIRNVRNGTGMLVTSSLPGPLTLQNRSVSKHQIPIARKTAHPWEEIDNYPLYPSPDSNPSLNDDFPLVESDHDYVNEIETLADILQLHAPELEVPVLPENETLTSANLDEHSYTNNASDGNEETNEDDVGVCLHVSKHRVSLEFCSGCSESASNNWKRSDEAEAVN